VYVVVVVAVTLVLEPQHQQHACAGTTNTTTSTSNHNSLLSAFVRLISVAAFNIHDMRMIRFVVRDDLPWQN
jgi:hypothetical protein